MATRRRPPVAAPAPVPPAPGPPALHDDPAVGSLDTLLRAAAARWPDRPALDSPRGAYTYAELDAAVSAAAAGLLDAGARPGDRVAFALSHDAPLYAAPFACSRAGVSGLLLDSGLAPERWMRQLRVARPALCVADDAHAARLRRATGGAPVAPAATALPLAGTRPEPAGLVDAEHAVVLLATSGSTGEPAVVRLTEGGLLHVARAYLDVLDLHADERSLVVAPLTFVGALSTQTVTMPLVGGCNVLPADRRPAGAARTMAAQGITFLDAVPSWLTLLVREAPQPVPTLRTIVYGGEPMPPATVEALAVRHPGAALYDVWGLTEAHGPVTAQRYDPAHPPAPGTVGRPIAGLRVRAAGRHGPLPPGAPGELEVAGPTVGAGRLDEPDDGPRDGWLATGDIGVVDRDGTVRITGRREDLIVRGGANVSAREVEDVLAGAAGVAEVAVFAVPDGLGGDAVGAAVVPEPDGALDVAALRGLVAERVGVLAVPRRITRLDALPRTATGKVDRRALRDAHARSAGGWYP